MNGSSYRKARTLTRAFVCPTDLTLSCAARARVPKPRGALVAAYTAGQRHATCNQRDAATLVFGRGASAPGRSRAASVAVASWAAPHAYSTLPLSHKTEKP